MRIGSLQAMWCSMPKVDRYGGEVVCGSRNPVKRYAILN